MIPSKNKTSKSEASSPLMELVTKISGLSIGPSAKITNLNTVESVKPGVEKISFTSEVGGASQTHRWILYNQHMKRDKSKDEYVKTELGSKLISCVNLPDEPLPFDQLTYKDDKVWVIDEGCDYSPLNPKKALDENELKIGMKALARLHALSFVYFSSAPDTKALNQLSKKSLEDAGSRSEVQPRLEKQLDNIRSCLTKEGCSQADLEKVMALKKSLFNIYREATSKSSLGLVLCHGRPNCASLKFKCNSDGAPVQARFVSMDDCALGSAITDLHVFINTSGFNTAKEDFLLRFVYYETFATLLKSYGKKIGFTYDDLKSEFVQRKLHGCIHSAAILAEEGFLNKAIPQNQSTTVEPVVTKPTEPRVIESKFLGRFVPRKTGGNKTASGAASVKKILTGQDTTSSSCELIDLGGKIQELMMKAIKL